MLLLLKLMDIQNFINLTPNTRTEKMFVIKVFFYKKAKKNIKKSFNEK